MKWKVLVLTSAALIAGSGWGKAQVSASCVTCTSEQECAPGTDGAYCVIFYDNKLRQWCNWRDACGGGVALSPLDLSPAGMLLASTAGTVVREGREVQECSGYRVSSIAGDTGDDEFQTPTMITI